MAEGDSAAVDIDFIHIKAEFAAAVYSLSCESFVGFDKVEVFNFEVGFRQGFAGRRNRTGTHDGRVDTSRCIAYDFCHRFETEFFGFVSRHDDEGGSTVVDAGSVAGRYGTAFFEGRFQFSQAFHGRAFTREFVRVDDDVFFTLMDRNRNDLGFESAALNSFAGFYLRTDAHFVLIFTGNTEFFSYVFSRDAHVVVVESIP